MASIQKTATGYRAQVAIKGERDSKAFATRRDAVQWAADREREIRQGKTGTNATFAQAITRFIDEECPKRRSGDREGKRLNAILSQFQAPTRFADLSPDLIAQWRNERLKTVKGATVLRDMKLLATLFETARKEWGWIATNPVRDVKKPASSPHRDYLLTRRDIRLMLRALNHGREVRTMTQATALAFLFAMRTGMREGEICGVMRDAVFDGFIALPMTKNGTKREVPISRKAQLLLNRIKLGTAEVFGLNKNTLSTLFRRARLKAGLHGFTFHDSRHYAATQLAKKLDLLDLCRMFGWKDPKHALIYYNETASSIAKRL